jgi:hypothetical protein
MAVNVILRAGDTNAQDVSLVSNGIAITGYEMQTPDIDQQAISSLGDGNGLSVPRWSNVTESIDLLIQGTTADDTRAKIQSIEALIDQARQGTAGQQADKVYVRIQFDHDTEPWRSQILAARLVHDHLADQIWRKKVECSIIVTRRYYWETEAIKSIAMTSGPTSTATTGYVTVYNDDDADATNRNWFQIAADQIVGSIPAPARIYIKNISAGSRAVGTIYLGNYVFANPSTIDPIFRDVNLAGSNGVTTTEDDTFYWLLSANQMDSFRGQFARAVIVFSDRPAPTTLVRAALQYRFPTPVIDLALGEQVLSSAADFVVDLGSLPLPPGGYIAGMGANLYLTVKSKAASGTDTIGVDWIQLFPAGAGRYRVIKGFTNLFIAVNDQIIDDGPQETCYYLNGSTPKPVMRPFMQPIYLWPNKLQRLRMIISGGVSMEAGEEWGVKAEYRARRLTA